MPSELVILQFEVSAEAFGRLKEDTASRIPAISARNIRIYPKTQLEHRSKKAAELEVSVNIGSKFKNVFTPFDYFFDHSVCEQ